MQTLRSSADSSAHKMLNGIRIVIVEDDLDSRELLEELLLDAGASVKAADSAANGFQAYQAFRPQIVISDIGMPGEDGTSLARRIRASEPPDASPTPLIALTAFTQPHERARVMQAGFNLHVSKPFDVDALLDNVLTLTRASEE